MRFEIKKFSGRYPAARFAIFLTLPSVAGAQTTSGSEPAPQASTAEVTRAPLDQPAPEAVTAESPEQAAVPVVAAPLAESSEAPSQEETAEGASPETGPQTKEIRLRIIEGESPAPTSVHVPPEPEIDPETLPFTYHQRHVDVFAGVRFGWVPDSAFDPFSENDVTIAPQLRLGYAPWATGRFSLAVLGEWSYVGTSANARGTTAALSAHRLGVGFEGRYHFHHWWFGYGRLSPGVLLTSAEFGQGPNRLVGDKAGFRLDAVAGVAARILGSSDGRADEGRLFVYFEGGFDWALSQDLRLSPVEGGALRAVPLDLGALNWSGPHLGGGFAFTF